MKNLFLTFVLLGMMISSLLGQSTFSISGTFNYLNGSATPVDVLKVILNQGGTRVDSVMTDLTGNYIFAAVPNGIYNVLAYTTKPWMGVNATDAIKVQRHFVDLEIMTEPVKLQAGDVNLSNSINGTDAIKIKRRFSALDTSFARGDWTIAKPIVGGDTIIVNGANVNQNFYVLCVGDVNGSYIPSPTQELPVVTTAGITNIYQTSATGGGNVFSDGGITVTARGVCWSISPEPTTTDSHTTDGIGTGVFVSNLTGLIQNTLYYVRAYATNSAGTAYGKEVSFGTFNCGFITINHLVSGGVAPVDKTVTYGTVTNIPGETSKCWITSNLGSDHQAIAVNDATEASAGWYWQFNLKQGYKHDGSTRIPNTWVYGISENSNWVAANDPCTIELGGGWRLPTYVEWTNVDAGGNWNDWNVPWNSALKLHAAGSLTASGGSLSGRGSGGDYWSNAQYSASYGWLLYFGSGYSLMGETFKASGFSVRCVKD